MRLFRYNHSKQGFTLVELSIVLVIIGLLTGGVLSGQSLIRAAELKAVSTEYQKYIAATNAFRDKYQALPGDMNNAGSFWPAIGNVAMTSDKTSDVKGNGNGNGHVEGAGAASMAGEMFTFWEELALAGLIEGSYTGNAGAGSYAECLPGTNTPRSKFTNGGWGVQWYGVSGNTVFYNNDYGNFFIFGGKNGNELPRSEILKPEEAWNIDAKLDDGKPVTGKVVAVDYATCSTNAAGGTPAQTDTDGLYKLNSTSQACALAFTRAF